MSNQAIVKNEVESFNKKGFGVTRQTLAASLSWPINRVSGRVAELVKSGQLVEKGTITTREGYSRGLLWINSK